MASLLRRIAVDTTALRASKDLRALVLGNFVTGMGTQAALVALPYQLYVQTHSTFLTGLLGAFELGPLMSMALIGGAIADRMDRRRILLLDQIGLVLLSAALAVLAFSGHPPIIVLYVLGGLLAGFSAIQNVVRSAIVPNLVDPVHLRSAIALNFGLYQLTMVVGPGLGGVLIGAAGVGWAYTVDAASCLAMVWALLVMAPQPPHEDGAGVAGSPRESLRRSITEGVRFVFTQKAVLGTAAIDLIAMTFGMPRALFPALSLGVYHSGAAGTGVLAAAVAAGATVAALTTGWLEHARWLGRITIAMVVLWGAAIALAGVTTSLLVAAVFLALAGAADSVSAVCRSTINQTVTPDAMRGRMSSAFTLVVTSGPRLGDIESGSVAAATSPRFSVTSGGLACIGLAGLIAVLLPALRDYDGEAYR